MNKRNLALGLFLGSLVFGLCACGKSKATLSKLTACTRDFLDELSTPNDPNDPVVARLAGIEIRQSNLQMQYDSQQADTKAKFQSPKDNANLLNSYVNQSLYALAAEKAGLTRDPKVRRMLAWQRRNSLASLYRNRMMETTAAVSDAEVRRYYDDHLKQLYGPQTEIQASHIVVRAKADAEKVLGLLKAKKAFAEVAQTYSIDKKSASAGGTMPAFRAGTGSPKVEAALLALQDGQITGILPAGSGFQVLRRDSVVKKPAVPFETVKQDIRRRLEWEKTNPWLQSQKTASGLEVDEEKLNSLLFTSSATLPVSASGGSAAETSSKPPKGTNR